MVALSLREVCKSFGSVEAVKGLDVAVPEGSIYGFLGPNGAGKTTTIRMIMRIIYPDSGRIEVFGKEGDEGVRQEIGYLPEERGLYRKMKVQGVLTYIAAIKRVPEKERAGRVKRWLDEMGLADWRDRRVEELSRGMQQKIQFIATVISDPRIVILDEPFAALDPVNLDLMKTIILRMRDEGKTVILSTHMMEQAEQLCDSIVLIDKGRKVIDGPLDQVRNSFRTRAIVTEIEGDSEFLKDLPGVEKIHPMGKKLELVLEDYMDPQDILRVLAEKVRVRSFSIKVPSLHEIFVHLVGRNDA